MNRDHMYLKRKETQTCVSSCVFKITAIRIQSYTDLCIKFATYKNMRWKWLEKSRNRSNT